MKSINHFTSVFWILIFNVLLTKNAQINNTGLYSLGDKIEIFTIENYRLKLNNQPFVWLVEFYAHWCGHCQRFAPIWKKFALDIENWTPIVRLAAVNCADELNIEVCREFQIDHYPSLRFFHEKYNSGEGKIGESFTAVEEIWGLRANLIEKLIQEQQKGRGKTWPKLSQCTTSLTDLLHHPRPTHYTILIIEPETSTLGRELLLDFHTLQLVALKVIKDTNWKILNQLFPDLNFESPSLIVLDKKLSYLSITPQNKTRETFAESIQNFCKSVRIEIPEVSQPLYNKDIPIQKDLNLTLYETKLQPTDKVYLSDLEFTLHQAIIFEIPAQTKISGEKLEALREFLRVILRYFPLTQRGRVMYTELQDQAMEVKSEISGRAIYDFASAMEKTYKPYAQKLEWIRCKGTSPIYRGYPCGLWTLFHVLTLAEMKVSSTSTVLNAMLGYVKHFFGCRHCSQHFQQMAADKNLSRVEDSAEAVLWLWNAHNTVNQRLAGDPTEDPKFPKVIFPKQVDCPECYQRVGSNGEIFWNRNSVLVYLRRIYEKFVVYYYPKKPYFQH